MLAVAVRLHGGAVVDVSASTSALLRPGDALAYQILTGNFSSNAARYGLDPNPVDISFTFATAPVNTPAAVSAWLESTDGSVAIAFAGPLEFTPGLWESSQFQGPVSTLGGYLHLSGGVSAEIFGSGAAQLVLRNEGDSFAVGLPPTMLRQDLFVSLTGGPLSVGALDGLVSLVSGSPGSGGLLSGGASPQDQAPEPATMLTGLLAMALVWRAARMKNQTFANR